MPGGNRTGPLGNGPKTGRAMGVCAGFKVPEYANLGSGRGCGRGLGRGGRMGQGRGFGRGFGFNGVGGPYPEPQNLTSDQEVEALQSQTKYLEDSLKETKQRIEELQNGK